MADKGDAPATTTVADPAAAEAQAQESRSFKLFIGQVPRAYTEADLRPHVEEFGEVVTLSVLRDRYTGSSKGGSWSQLSFPHGLRAAHLAWWRTVVAHCPESTVTLTGCCVGCAFLTFTEDKAAQECMVALHDKVTLPGVRAGLPCVPANPSRRTPLHPSGMPLCQPRHPLSKSSRAGLLWRPPQSLCAVLSSAEPPPCGLHSPRSTINGGPCPLQMPHSLQVKPADEHGRQASDERKLFIGMVSKTATEDELRLMFNPFGTIEDLTVLRGPDDVSRGCAFIKYSKREEASAAVAAMHNCGSRATLLEELSLCPLLISATGSAREAPRAPLTRLCPLPPLPVRRNRHHYAWVSVTDCGQVR